MKYGKEGPREFVPYEFDEVTLENIKIACRAHYREDLACDVLASEQGPSCSRIDQIPNFKMIYVRFISDTSNSRAASMIEYVNPCNGTNPKIRKVDLTQSTSNFTRVDRPNSSVIAKSLSAVDMMKCGKIVRPVEKEIRDIDIKEFVINKKNG